MISFSPLSLTKVTVRWDNKSKEFKLMFGVVGPRSATNCHSLLKHCLQQELNEHKALPVLLRVNKHLVFTCL